MDFKNIENRLKELDHEWFLAKKKFFKIEPSYKPNRDIIEVILDVRYFNLEDGEGGIHEVEECPSYDIDFFKYCLNSNFQDSLYLNNDDYDDNGPFQIHTLPIDAEPICKDILKYLEFYLNNIHELVDKDFAIRSTVIEIKQALSLPEDLQGDEYSITKNKLFQYIRRLITEKYGNIRSILNRRSLVDPSYKKLSIKICLLICNITFEGKKFISNFETRQNHDISEEEYLFELLKVEPTTTLKGYFYNEWRSGDFHALFTLLEQYLTIDFKNLEFVRSFQNLDKPFSYRNYRKAKSIAIAQNTIPEELKQQVSKIFEM